MADLTAQELVDAALRILGAVDPGETPGTTERNNGLEAMRIMLRQWSAKGLFVFASTEDTHTLDGSQSYTIGSGATINTTRPVKIVSAFVRANGLDRALGIIGLDEYASIQQKGLGGDYPHCLYYLPGYSTGTIYLYPPGGGELHIWSHKPLTDPTTLGGDITFPGEYDAAIKYTLAVHMAPEYGGLRDPLVGTLAQEAMDDVIRINAVLSADSVDVPIVRGRRIFHIDDG